MIDTPSTTDAGGGDLPRRRPPGEVAQASLAQAALLLEQAARALTEEAVDAPNVVRSPWRVNPRGPGFPMWDSLQTCVEFAVEIGQVGAKVGQWADGLAEAAAAKKPTP